MLGHTLGDFGLEPQKGLVARGCVLPQVPALRVQLLEQRLQAKLGEQTRQIRQLLAKLV